MPNPLFYRQVTPLPTAGNVPIDTRAMTAPMRELANLGNTIAGVGLDVMKMNTQQGIEQQRLNDQAEYYDQLNTAKLTSMKADQEWTKERDTIPDTSTWEETLKKRQTEIVPKFTNTKAQGDYNVWKQEHDIGQQNETLSHKGSIDARNYQTNYNAQTSLLTKQIVEAATEQDAQMHRNELAGLSGYHYDEKNQLVENDGPRNTLWHDPATMKLMVEKQTSDAETDRQKYLGEQLYAAASEKVAALANSDMTKDAFSKAIDADPAYAGIPRSGIRSKESLSNDFVHWKEFYKGQDEKNRAARDLQATQDFTKALTGKTDKPLTMNTIAEMYPNAGGEDKTNREQWQARLDGSFAKDLVADTTADGQSAVMAVLIDAGKGTQTTQEAIKTLLDHRYVDKDISQKTFDWAMNKIENPYPSATAAHLQATTEAVRRSITGRWESAADVEQTAGVNDAIMQNVNEGLLQWVDSEIEAGRTPKAVDIYTEAKQLEAGAKSGVDANETDLMKRHLVNEKKLVVKQAESKAKELDLMKRHIQNNRRLGQPTQQELRKQNTKEAYQKGVELGYWK